MQAPDAELAGWKVKVRTSRVPRQVASDRRASTKPQPSRTAWVALRSSRRSRNAHALLGTDEGKDSWNQTTG